MNFDKTSEQVIRFDNFPGYFLIREFRYDEPTPNPIAEFMKSRYFSWQEEFRNEVTVTVNNQDKIVHWNFHGLYDINKLQPEDFDKISPADFTHHFSSFIQSNIGFDKKTGEVQAFLNKLEEINSEYYIIKDLPDDKKHDWTVFDFFLSGFKISKDLKILIAVECGLD